MQNYRKVILIIVAFLGCVSIPSLFFMGGTTSIATPNASTENVEYDGSFTFGENNIDGSSYTSFPSSDDPLNDGTQIGYGNARILESKYGHSTVLESRMSSGNGYREYAFLDGTGDANPSPTTGVQIVEWYWAFDSVSYSTWSPSPMVQVFTGDDTTEDKGYVYLRWEIPSYGQDRWNMHIIEKDGAGWNQLYKTIYNQNHVDLSETTSADTFYHFKLIFDYNSNTISWNMNGDQGWDTNPEVFSVSDLAGTFGKITKIAIGSGFSYFDEHFVDSLSLSWDTGYTEGDLLGSIPQEPEIEPTKYLRHTNEKIFVNFEGTFTDFYYCFPYNNMGSRYSLNPILGDESIEISSNSQYCGYKCSDTFTEGTIECYYKPTSLPQEPDRAIIMGSVCSSKWSRLFVKVKPDGTVYATHYNHDTSSWSTVLESSDASSPEPIYIQSDVVYHIAYTWSSASRNLYINGILRDSDTIVTPDVENNYYWGFGDLASSNNWDTAKGIYDEFRVSSVQLSNFPEYSDLFLASDGDLDGLSNELEIEHQTCFDNSDTDGDTLSDGDEHFATYGYYTDPTEEDTDQDSINDQIEVFGDLGYFTNPTDNDHDGDGLYDNEEYLWGTSPRTADSDGDLLVDGYEVNIYGTNPTLPDTDGDSLSDGEEKLYNFNPFVQEGTLLFVHENQVYCGIAFIAWINDDILPDLDSEHPDSIMSDMEKYGYLVLTLEDYGESEFLDAIFDAQVMANYYQTRLVCCVSSHGMINTGAWITKSFAIADNDLCLFEYDTYSQKQRIDDLQIQFQWSQDRVNELKTPDYDERCEELVFYAAPCFSMVYYDDDVSDCTPYPAQFWAKRGTIFGNKEENWSDINLVRTGIRRGDTIQDIYNNAGIYPDKHRYISWGQINGVDFDPSSYTIPKMKRPSPGCEYTIDINLLNKDGVDTTHLGMSDPGWSHDTDYKFTFIIHGTTSLDGSGNIFFSSFDNSVEINHYYYDWDEEGEYYFQVYYQMEIDVYSEGIPEGKLKFEFIVSDSDSPAFGEKYIFEWSYIEPDENDLDVRISVENDSGYTKEVWTIDNVFQFNVNTWTNWFCFG